MRAIHAHHEHCACAMAIGYHRATGKTGVASVTCGPGVTQISTALATAVRANIPLVLLAGESPINAKFYNQAIDQGPIAHATGAHYVRAHSTTQEIGRRSPPSPRQGNPLNPPSRRSP
jgi:acetolactate synthase-1/2/3 large subunit